MLLEQQSRLSPLSQFALLLGITGAGVLIGTMVIYFLADYMLQAPITQLQEELKKAENASMYRILQFLTTFLYMALPAYLFSVITYKKPLHYLGFTIAPKGKQFFLVVVLVFTALFISSALGDVNKMIPVSDSMTTYFKAMEKEYNESVLVLTNNIESIADFLLALVMLALLPALFEEVFFRGCMQQVFTGLFRNATTGIIVTSIIFSAIHFSFYGFIPRFFLGIMLGYIFYFSKNIWLSITAHFLNNAIALTQLYSLSRNGKLTSEMPDESFPIYYGIFAVVVFVYLFILFKRESEYVISMHNIKNFTNKEDNLTSE